MPNFTYEGFNNNRPGNWKHECPVDPEHRTHDEDRVGKAKKRISCTVCLEYYIVNLTKVYEPGL